MKKLLWLPSWYPNRLSPYSGDFIQRQALALALCQPVCVLFVIKDEEGVHGSDVYIERKSSANLEEVIAYYKPRKTGIRPIDRILSIRKYTRVYKQLIRSYIEKEGLPPLVHVHVAMWAGVLGRWLKKKYGVPYIVTEHWTGYDKNDPDGIHTKDVLFRNQLKKVIKNASLVLPVSARLEKNMAAIAPVPGVVVPNVVDTRYFNDSNTRREDFRFIHVSAMNYQKNAEGILRSFGAFVSSGGNARLVMVGPAGQALKDMSAQLGLGAYVDWKGEIPYTAVAGEMKQASALVLFSRYENLPCVILEAQCCGLPVIATRTGGIAEVVDEKTGYL